VNKAVVLAAGKGTRMGDLTAELPKPMLLVAGKPLLEHVLDRLRQSGIEAVFIVAGYRAEKIEQYFSSYPLHITFGRQDVIDGTARAALLAREFVGDDTFLLTYGDILTDPENYVGISASLELNPDVASVLGVKQVDDPWQGAAVYEAQGRVTKIVEKPAAGTSHTHWDSAGLYAFRAAFFQELAQVTPSVRGEYELTSAIQNQLAAGLRLEIYELAGLWRDVGRPEDLALMSSILATH
jgi:UDP-N-acetylglucosamine diphosphorylase / glucose-1-phosphate thymidylyltransferase / UDP-N-acetylgalactosamine diphosphorylase / glucosamine-1-phosphate N-acetyltransferase / galactosamine-1-phosphate N-acetyltransferase